MKRALIAVVLLAAACDSKTKTPEPAPTDNATVAPAAATNAAPAAVEAPAEPPAVESDAFKLAETQPKTASPEVIDIQGGTLAGVVQFTDANGENLAAIWSDKDQGLFAAHVLIGEDARVSRELRTIKQLRGDCEFDYSAEFMPGSFGATDLDKDGYGEVTFAYKFACRSDMSPEDYKVLVLENGEKSALRGYEILIMPQEEPIGDGKAEPEGFDNAPALLEHAKGVWKKHLVKQL